MRARRPPARPFSPAVLALLGAVAGCAGGGTSAESGLPIERRAALAHLIVENLTDQRVTIAFRYAIEPGGEITLGQLMPGETRQLPPIPAAEPIVLTARAATFERRLEPRSFDLDEVWTWVIRAPAGGEGT